MNYPSCMLLGALILAMALAPTVASATPNFPGVIEQNVATLGPPPCSLCHQADIRNNYSVKTPFGAALKQRGLVPENESSLRQALEMLRSDAADSDNDGVSDIDELEAGRDPNLPGDQAPGPQPSYGCNVRSPKQADGGAIGVSITLALLAIGWRRRRPRPC